MNILLRTLVRILSLLCCLLSMAGAESLPEPEMTYLDNGIVRIGMDLALGGAVTFISSTDHPGNMINSADLGRQIQMSHYSGPVPFEAAGKKPKPHWAGLGWNPIQTGDSSYNPSKVLEHRNDGKELYIRCIPMQWPLDNVPGDCVFETWTTLDGPIIRMRFRCTNQREDKTFYPPAAQELPAVYTISTLHRLMSYTGDQPFTGGELTHVTNDWRAAWPWTKFTATERWAALVNDAGYGLGVFKNDGGEFHGGIHGEGRSDDPKHGSTAYVAPIHRENFDHNIMYEHETFLMVGQLDEIRERFNAMATQTAPQWDFTTDRQHWTLENGTDAGLPLDGAWRIRFGEKLPLLTGPTLCWRAEDARVVVLEMAYEGVPTKARLHWKRLDDDDAFNGTKSQELELIPGGEFQIYEIDLSASPEYRGLVTGLRFVPDAKGASEASLSIRSIRLQ